jgi:hypothetical protein
MTNVEFILIETNLYLNALALLMASDVLGVAA